MIFFFLLLFFFFLTFFPPQNMVDYGALTLIFPFHLNDLLIELHEEKKKIVSSGK